MYLHTGDDADSPGFLVAPSLTTTSHGNGFVNTGALDTDDNSPNPSTGAIKFTQAGTFKLYCLVHPFMVGTVTVQ